jgi:hypothetical protein
MFTDVDYFEALNGRKFRFSKMASSTKALVWEKFKNEDGWNKETCTCLDIHYIPTDTLKSLKIWDTLNAETQASVIEAQSKDEEMINALEESCRKGRKGRKSKLTGFPKIITCVQCHSEVKVCPSVLNKKLEKIGKTIEEYIKDYHCTTCVPVRKGRVSSGKCKSVDLVCKCGNKVSYPLNLAQKMADKKGKILEAFVNEYVCQVCNPTKGRQKKA